MPRIRALLLIVCAALPTSSLGQTASTPPENPILTLGVFHFAYPNLDAVTTRPEDQISVLDEPYQSEIVNLTRALLEFRPTIIAVEELPERQAAVDSAYAEYLAGRFELGKNEIHQLGFRLGEMLGLPRIYCVDDMGRHYPNLVEIFEDEARRGRFESYFLNSPDTMYAGPRTAGKVSSIIEALDDANDPNRVEAELGLYLLRQFKYEEEPGDFTGVDFETGRWFNRNLRIFRNIQRIPRSADDRLLLIIGSGHLNVLNHLFDVSREFDLVSPQPYLQSARALGERHAAP